MVWLLRSHLSLGWWGAEGRVLGFVWVGGLRLHHPAPPYFCLPSSSATLPGPPPTDPTQSWGRSLLPTSPARRTSSPPSSSRWSWLRSGQELAGLVQMVADIKGWFWGFVGTGTLLWPPPCSASSGLPPLPSAHTLLLRCSAQKFRCTSPKARWPPPMSQPPPARSLTIPSDACCHRNGPWHHCWLLTASMSA